MNTLSQNIDDRLNQALRELQMLYEVSCAMRTTLELNHILYIILTGVTSHSGLGFNRSILYLFNQKSQCLECKMAIGPESGEHASKIWQYIETLNPKLEDLIQADKINQTINESSLFKSLKMLKFSLSPENTNLLLVKAFQKAIPWHLSQEEISQYIQDPFLEILKTSELIIIPLKTKEKVKGLIVADNLYTQKPIEENDIKIFTMLANQAALAIENSQLYEMIVYKSHTDSLTDLWNHGYFQEKLTYELERAKKTNQPLGLVLIDIDNFKDLNDTYGHQFGDTILKELAMILKQSSRETDYVCRYGGEEFTLILPQTNKEKAYEIAERLRSRIEQYSFSPYTQPKNLKLTISLGVATYPVDAITKEELISKADKAMYIAKFSGKNKSCLADAL